MSAPGRDEALLELLAAALQPGAVEPSRAELAHLHRALAKARRAPAPAPRWRGWLPRAAAALTGGVVVLGGGAAAAWASGATLPTPLRSAAVAIGLPVDDAAVASARRDMGRLRKALRKADAAQVASDAAVLRSRLARMDTDDRSEVEPQADRELARSDELLGGPGPASRPTGPGAGAPGSEGAHEPGSEGAHGPGPGGEGTGEGSTGGDSERRAGGGGSGSATGGDGDRSSPGSSNPSAGTGQSSEATSTTEQGGGGDQPTTSTTAPGPGSPEDD